MSCQTCCKIFCSRRDKKENCSEKITYVEAGILEKVKTDKTSIDSINKVTDIQETKNTELKNEKKYNSLKEKIKEELERAKKENEPYEEYEIESRMYWINQGKISLAKKLLEDK